MTESDASVEYRAIELALIRRLQQTGAAVDPIRDPYEVRATRDRLMAAAMQAEAKASHPSVTGRIPRPVSSIEDYQETARSVRTLPPHSWNFRHPAVKSWNRLTTEEVLDRMDAVLERQCDRSPE